MCFISISTQKYVLSMSVTSCQMRPPPLSATQVHVTSHMRLLDIDDSVIAELVVGMLAARHVAAFARASSHCAELAKRALQFDGPRGAEAALRLAEGRGVDELCQRWPVLVLPRLGSPPLVGALATIGDRAFYGCSSLTTITLPAGLATIGRDAFFGCTSLTTITLSGGLTTIGNAAFYRCSSLTTITPSPPASPPLATLPSLAAAPSPPSPSPPASPPLV